MENICKYVIKYDFYGVVQIVNFRAHVTRTLGPSSISGNCDKFQEISEFSSGYLSLSCENNAVVVNCLHYARQSSTRFPHLQ